MDSHLTRRGVGALVLGLVTLVLVGGSRTPLRADESRDLRKDFVRAVQEISMEGVQVALDGLVRAGGKLNIAVILKALPQVPPTEDTLYWKLVEGACSFIDEEALDELGETIVRHQRTSISRDLLFGLSANRSHRVIIVLRPIVRKAPQDLRLLAIEKAGDTPSPQSVDLLLEVLAEEEKYVDEPSKAEALDTTIAALERITGQSYGASLTNWAGWWEKNRETTALGRRARGERRDTGTVVDSLDRQREKEFFGLEKAPKKGVVVLSAEYGDPTNRDLNNDHIQRVLSNMGVPHVVVKREEFPDHDLSEAGALIINCAQFHEFCICPTCVPSGERNNRLWKCSGCDKHVKFSAKLGPNDLKKIKDFVKKGGYVFAEDWVVKEVLQELWPKIIETGGRILTRPEPHAPVDVVPERGMVTHPYLRGIFRRVEADDGDDIDLSDDDDDDDDDREGKTVVGSPEDEDPEVPELVDVKHTWAVDDESWTFNLLDKSKVLVLMASGQLQKKQEGRGTVAFAFRPGGSPQAIGRAGTRATRSQPGVVLQVLSHFGKQQSVADEHLLQNLLLNFLIDANVERESRAELSTERRRVE